MPSTADRRPSLQIDLAFGLLSLGGLAHAGIFLLMRTAAATGDPERFMDATGVHALSVVLAAGCPIGYAAGVALALRNRWCRPLWAAAVLVLVAAGTSLLANVLTRPLQASSRLLFTVADLAFVVIVPVVLLLSARWAIARWAAQRRDRARSTAGATVAPACRACGAGESFCFVWSVPDASADHRHDRSAFVPERVLRHGALHRCSACGQTWYLDDDEHYMYRVAPDRLPLIERWSERPILLSPAQRNSLARIGATPRDVDDVGGTHHDTPCAVTTSAGERFELAIVARQRHAPVETWRRYRLASDIRAIEPSPLALSPAVRAATARAPQVRPDFAPTLVCTPTGKLILFDTTQNFYDGPDCAAGELRLADPSQPYAAAQASYLGPKQAVTYFVADLDD